MSWLPPYHDMGLIACLVLPLLTSTRTVLMSPFDWVGHPWLMMQQISEERGTLCWLPNFAYFHSAKRISEFQMSDVDLSTLRGVVSCSEPATPAAFETFYRTFSKHGLRYSALSSSYVMAETTFAVTQSPIGHSSKFVRVDSADFIQNHIARQLSEDDASQNFVELVSSGPPLRGCKIEIVDEDGIMLPDGHVGEIRIRCDYLMDGYFRDEEETTQALRNGWYFSGDLGFILDNHLYVTGRKKDMIIVSGQNIYPHYIEELVSEFPGIHSGRVVAFGVFDEDEGTEQLVILAETQKEQETERSKGKRKNLSELIRESVLGKFGVTVSDIRFYAHATLLESTSGKLSREMNRELYLASFKDG